MSDSIGMQEKSEESKLNDKKLVNFQMKKIKIFIINL
jgi:hypothetical protein